MAFTPRRTLTEIEKKNEQSMVRINFIVCIKENGDLLGSRKDVYLPSDPVDLLAIFEMNKCDLKFRVEQGEDMNFVSKKFL